VKKTAPTNLEQDDVDTDPPLAAARRSDAERNRRKILAVARDAFAQSGGEPSMAQIARSAGVGMATLYRNFPSRRDLVEELYRSQINDLCDAAETVTGTTPGERFFAWLDTFRAAGASKGALASLLLADSSSDAPILNESRSRVVAAVEPLFAAAQQTGEVRSDISLGGICDAIVALGQVQGDRPHPASMVQVLLEGLRRQGN
jgi:AcrR family transcriptional regulator